MVSQENIHGVTDGLAARSYLTNTVRGHLDVVSLRNKLVKGESIRLTNAQTYSNSILLACRAFENATGLPINANVYITPAGNQAFNPHYDDHDVFILQCDGAKEWSIYGDYEQSVKLPNGRLKFEKAKHIPKSEGISDFTLETGDLLYIPRGVMHDARCSNDFSIHITFGAGAITWSDYIKAAANLLNDSDVEYRELAELNVMGDSQKLSTLKEKLEPLLEKISQVDPVEIENQLFQYWAADKGNYAAAPISSALKREVEPVISNSSYRLIHAARASYRLFVDEDKKYNLWTITHSAEISEREYELLIELRDTGELLGTELDKKLGKEGGADFASSLSLIGIASYKEI